MEYWRADDSVVKLTERIIADKRPQLAQSEIVIMFREKAGTKGSKVVIATARKVSEKDNVIHSWDGKPDIDFVIEIGANIWNELDDEQKEAVLFHELNHCDVQIDDETGIEKNIIRGHSIEEFTDVVDHYGFYMDDVQKFAQAIMNSKNKEKE
jgi:hypothetical protein